MKYQTLIDSQMIGPDISAKSVRTRGHVRKLVIEFDGYRK